jgi:hypothetical protein
MSSRCFCNLYNDRAIAGFAVTGGIWDGGSGSPFLLFDAVCFVGLFNLFAITRVSLSDYAGVSLKCNLRRPRLGSDLYKLDLVSRRGIKDPSTTQTENFHIERPCVCGTGGNYLSVHYKFFVWADATSYRNNSPGLEPVISIIHKNPLTVKCIYYHKHNELKKSFLLPLLATCFFNGNALQ